MIYVLLKFQLLLFEQVSLDLNIATIELLPLLEINFGSEAIDHLLLLLDERVVVDLTPGYSLRWVVCKTL